MGDTLIPLTIVIFLLVAICERHCFPFYRYMHKYMVLIVFSLNVPTTFAFVNLSKKEFFKAYI